ncbi:DUF2478 domain-containing protein [uncultured Alsobacter sp.]|uniref:DUF2478 domain-containing protein n=1 Tax=uncultured Alsobacter sp. TaxID=1748258 RepID=UPI0025CF0AA4|nr:DUF2478 domain-containing protein [uncultured Alsobacter sp.]
MTGSLVAIVYGDGARADALLHAVAAALAREGRVVTGLLPHAVQRPGRSRCDMVLEDPRSGERIRISEDRGEMARGCRLDLGELLRAGELVRRALDDRPDLVIVNKFGKSEAEGGGLRDVLAEIAAAEIPLLIAVPRRNLDAWRRFTGGDAVEIDLDAGPAESDGALAAVTAVLAAVTAVLEDRGSSVRPVEAPVC